MVAAALATGIFALFSAVFGAARPAALAARQARGSWLASAAFPTPARILAGAVLPMAVLAAVVGLILVTRQGRKFAARKLLPPVRSSLASLGRVARSPVRLALLFGGSALVTLAYIGGLIASVAAFGASASIAQVGAVYPVASLIAAASPTPGGLGAIEVAAIAGLTGIGVSSGAAVSAVIIYRLATYWLPVLPGWLSWRLLQRMEYV